MRRVREIIIGVAVAIAAISAANLFWSLYSRGQLGLDFYVYWRTARLPITEIYRVATDGPFVNPPTAAMWLEPLGLLGRWAAYYAFVLISMAIFCWAALASYTKQALLLCLAAPPIVSGLLFGQMSLLLGALILIAFRLPSVPKGALLALVISIKPQMAFLAPVVLWDERKAIASMIGTGVALFGLNLALLGVQPWIDWIDALPAFRQILIENKVTSALITPAGFAMRFGLNPLPLLVVGLVAGVSFAFIRPAWIDRPALLVGCCALASPYALPHDLAAMMPWAATLLLQKEPDLKTGVGFYLYLCLVFPIIWMATCMLGLRRSTGRLLRHRTGGRL